MMKPWMKACLLPLVCLSLSSSHAQITYQPNWESLDSRPNPAWFDEAKFGIFIHWGVYSVPAWAPKGKYSEWYWHSLLKGDELTQAFHNRVYGEAFKYPSFASMFKAEMFDPNEWAGIFKNSGARYVVLTSKHHDGYCLWPSRESWNWNSVDTGPHRDLCGDLADAVRKQDLKMGYYYSLYEWFNPLYQSDVNAYVDQHMLPQIKDMVERYKPSLIFSDGEWDHPSETWRSTEFLAWLFNESPCRDEVVVDDRWGKDTRGKHGGYYTTEYGDRNQMRALAQVKKWEECRGMGGSFGYSRNEALADYKPVSELIHLLVEIVSHGGNLLLDIGPTADGRIPVIMQELLNGMGEWLATNGEAIYGSDLWRESSEGENIRYTCKGEDVYVFVYNWPGRKLVLEMPRSKGQPTASLLGCSKNIPTKSVDKGIELDLSDIEPQDVKQTHTVVFKLNGVE